MNWVREECLRWPLSLADYENSLGLMCPGFVKFRELLEEVRRGPETVCDLERRMRGDVRCAIGNGGNKLPAGVFVNV